MDSVSNNKEERQCRYPTRRNCSKDAELVVIPPRDMTPRRGRGGGSNKTMGTGSNCSTNNKGVTLEMKEGQRCNDNTKDKKHETLLLNDVNNKTEQNYHTCVVGDGDVAQDSIILTEIRSNKELEVNEEGRNAADCGGGEDDDCHKKAAAIATFNGNAAKCDVHEVINTTPTNYAVAVNETIDPTTEAASILNLPLLGTKAVMSSAPPKEVKINFLKDQGKPKKTKSTVSSSRTDSDDNAEILIEEKTRKHNTQLLLPNCRKEGENGTRIPLDGRQKSLVKEEINEITATRQLSNNNERSKHDTPTKKSWNCECQEKDHSCNLHQQQQMTEENNNSAVNFTKFYDNGIENPNGNNTDIISNKVMSDSLLMMHKNENGMLIDDSAKTTTTATASSLPNNGNTRTTKRGRKAMIRQIIVLDPQTKKTLQICDNCTSAAREFGIARSTLSRGKANRCALLSFLLMHFWRKGFLFGCCTCIIFSFEILHCDKAILAR